MDVNAPAGLPAALAELLKKAAGLLGGAESRMEAGSALSVESLLRAAIETEMDVDRLRRLSLLLSEFDRYYLAPADGSGGADAAILIEDGPLLARLTLVPARAGGAPVQAVDVLKRLKERKIVHGVKEEAVRAACQVASRRETVHLLPVAAGDPAQDGEDGSVSFAVKAFDKRLLLDTEESFFGDLLGLVEDVKAGALVARITPGDAGRPGRDIRGGVLSARPGLPVSLAVGEGLQVLAEGRELHALVAGSLVVGEDTLDLAPFHVVDGQLNVGQDLSFDGHVLVTGHVQGPIRIQARDIYIAGNAEAAQLSASGDVWVGGAIRGKSAVEAEGRVFARSLSDAAVRAVGDVAISDSIVESRVTSSGRVRMRQGQGLIEGGDVSAFRGVTAHALGSAYGLPTSIKVGVEDFRAPLLAELDKRIRENEESLTKIDDLKSRLAVSGKTARNLSPDRQVVYISVLRKEIQALEEIRSLRRRRKKLEAGREAGAAPSLTVSGTILPPVSVEIGEVSQVLQDRLEGVVLSMGADRHLKIVKLETAARGAPKRW